MGNVSKSKHSYSAGSGRKGGGPWCLGLLTTSPEDTVDQDREKKEKDVGPWQSGQPTPILSVVSDRGRFVFRQDDRIDRMGLKQLPSSS